MRGVRLFRIDRLTDVIGNSGPEIIAHFLAEAAFVLGELQFHHGAGGSGAMPRIRSEARSAIMITAALMLAPGTLGITEASTTRRPSTPFTRRLLSTTASGSSPIRQV